MVNEKKWFESKMIMVNIMAGIAMIVGVFMPSVGAFIAEHFSAVGGGWAMLNIVLRLVTKKEIA
jgi:uncharacterized membrane protein YqaE (UPF0057 family)